MNDVNPSVQEKQLAIFVASNRIRLPSGNLFLKNCIYHGEFESVPKLTDISDRIGGI